MSFDWFTGNLCLLHYEILSYFSVALFLCLSYLLDHKYFLCILNIGSQRAK
jgi:hypothetical protein